MPPDIIDTHLHIWNFSKAEYPWLKGNDTLLNRNYDINELNEQRVDAGVTKGVLVQAANNLQDTDWMLQVASETEWICGIVGWLPLTDPDEVEQLISGKYSQEKYFKGVRHLIHDEPDDKWLLQSNVLESLQILADKNLVFDVVGILPSHIETALAVAEKVPRLKMVFDHINQPPIKTNEQYGKWGELMKEASQNRNFYIKISGLGATTGKGHDWTQDDVLTYIDYALSLYGEDRCFCGSDWPVSLLSGDYVKTWHVYKTVLSTLLSEDAQHKVYNQNATAFYKLNDLN